MRIIARFEKRGAARFVSHLDVQRLFQRAFRRAKIPVAYSQGFNPHPVLAFATALSVGFTSSAEWLDVKLESEIAPELFVERVNEELPSGFYVREAILADDKIAALSSIMCAANYEVSFLCEVEDDALQTAIDSLLGGAIIVNKHTKGGMKDVDLRPKLYRLTFERPDKLLITGEVSAQGSHGIDLLMVALSVRLGKKYPYSVHRSALYSKDGLVMPRIN